MSLQVIVQSATEHGKSELRRVDFLDGWRGVAIALVLISHFFPVSGIDLGRMGVDVFFVLSGMLMSNILFIKRVELSTFYKRRISRIVPIFFIFVSTVYCLSYFFGSSEDYKNYLYTLFFLRTYFPVEPGLWDTGLPIGHIWSLNVEEHCYILLSSLTLFAVFRRKEYIPLFILGGSSILLNYFYTKFPSIAPADYHLNTEVVASHLLISSGYFLIKHRVDKYVPSWLPVITFILSLMCYHSMAPWFAPWLISPFLLAFTVNHLNSIPPFIKVVLEYKPLRLLGLWSFSIYLWQQPIYSFGIKSGEVFNFAGPVLFTASVIIGASSFYLLENPIRRYINNKW